MRCASLLLWVLIFATFNVLLFMAMAPGTPWLMTAFNLSSIVLLTLWYYGYFISGARRYRGFAVAGGLFILVVSIDMLVRGVQAWHDDSCEVFLSRRRLGLFQELVRLLQHQDQCQGLGAGVALLGLGMLLASLYLFWVQLHRLRLKPWCD